MSKCSRCESLPAGWPEVGVLYIAPPLAHTRGTLRRLLWKSDLPFGDPHDDVLAVEVTPEGLKHLSELLLDSLSEAELGDCRSVLVEKGSAFDPSVLSRMQDLATLTAVVRDEWLVDILREDRLAVHFQPIVPSADPSQVFSYECLLRGLDSEGAPVSPGTMFEAARSTGLLFNLDRAARVKAVEEAAGLGLESNVFINFNPASIYDPTYCLRSTMGAIGNSDLSPDRVVFEVTESTQVKDDRHLRNILDVWRKSGFRIALDDLGASHSSLNLLVALRPDFVKLDMGLSRDVDRDPYRAAIASKLLELARDLGVPVIAEGVETEEQWRWLAAHGADYAQGYFFAKPAFPPPIPDYAQNETLTRVRATGAPLARMLEGDT
ncbi:MAG: EAL domain-containing protein [Actinobacteria bacterium]|nr:EAL domain-containing protein [Actinomycetota bacterium]